MRCISCGAEMNVVRVQRDPAPSLVGYEQQILECSSCHDVETRTVLSPRQDQAQDQVPAQVPAQVPVEDQVQAPAQDQGPIQDHAPAGAEPVPHHQAPPTSAAVQPEDDLDASEELLRRAIDMVRGPAAGAQPARGLTDGLGHISPGIASEAELDEGEELLRRAIEMVRGPARSQAPTAQDTAGPAPAKPAPRPPGRIVQIFHDPNFDAAYAAKDTTSGLVVIRHQDSTRLRAMCERLGWRVIEGEASNAEA
jgi:hypothetical protein